MQSKIIGTVLPVLELQLDADERIVASPDHLSWMTPGFTLTTTTGGAGASGLFGRLSRAVSGGGLFMTEFHADQSATVGFAARLPGTILEVQTATGYMVHRDGFICGTPEVEVATALQNTLGGGLFGGEGFVLQKLSGNATAWIELGGELVSYQLAAGQMLQVHPGHVGMFEASVSFQITTMPGIKNALFGGDDLFLANLTGPGQVWLQTLTVPGLAHALAPYLPQKS